MPRYKIIIEYDGTNFAGWQKQKDTISVQKIIEDALAKLSEQEISVHASGRTDAGVHAIGQVAHFDLDKEMEDWKIRMALNHYLQSDAVAILSCTKVNNEFHSRFDAKLRHYQYKILNRRAKPVLSKYRAWHIPYELNLEAMKNSAKHLIGKHDFSSFRDAECQAKSPIRTLSKIEIEKIEENINITISAPSFLHHMVRNIVGTLVLVGGEKIKADDMKTILEAKDRTKSGPNAPAYGLYFYQVDY
jgi:tRNA pseudouridine38-40 synthase